MASKRAIRRRMCRKVKFPDEESAIKAASRARHRTGSRIWAYHCRWCGQWHIGHATAAGMQGQRNRWERL